MGESMRASLWIGCVVACTACGSGGTKSIAGDAETGDAGAADTRTRSADVATTPDAPLGAIDATTDGTPAPDASPDAAGDAPSLDTPAGPDLGSSVLDASSDAVADATMAGPGDARPDLAPACSPAPDQRGFYSSCSACPDPGDCDTIDINGSRRYACGCSAPCPCSLHCGSYVIPGTGISIGGICVR
jgi:hypothetical protein